MAEVAQIRSLKNNDDERSAEEPEIINLDDLEVASLPKKRARIETSTTPSNVPRKRGRKKVDGSHFKMRRATSAGRFPATADVV